MAVRQTFLFDAGPENDPIPVSGDIIQVSGAVYSADEMHGTYSVSIPDNTKYFRISNSGTASHSGSLYIKITGTPNPASSSARIISVCDSSNVLLLGIRMHSDGKFDICNAAGSRVVASTTTWSTNTWYRIDWQWDQVSTSAPVLTFRIFTTVEGYTAAETVTWTASGLSNNAGRWTIGMLTGTAGWAGLVDTWRIADGLEWIGPYNPPPGTVDHTWVGGPTSSSFRVVAKTVSATSTRLKVATNSGMTTGVVYTSAAAPDADGYVSHTITGLSSNTQYYYQIEDTPLGGLAHMIGDVGKGRTLPPSGSAQSFTFALAACVTNNNADGSAIADLRTWNPNFMIHTGDFHYRDPNTSTQATHAGHWSNQIAGAGTGEYKLLVRDVPMFYVRSDHDAGPGDNGDSNNASNQASINAYKQVVPHPTLADTRTPTVGLYFSWVIGRIRFIAIDIRNMDRSPGADAQSSSKTMLGSTQKQWLKDQLALSEPVKVIISDVSWPGPASLTTGTDKWWAYDHERIEIGDYIRSNNYNVLMLVGDNHSLAADDGSHNTWGGFPIYGAAPLANISGGRNLDYFDQTYNTGTNNDARQYGRITVTDNGSSIAFHYEGWDTISDTVKIDHTTTFLAPSVRQTWEFNEGPASNAIPTSGDLVTVSGATYTATAMHGDFAANISDNTKYFRINNTGPATHSGSMYVRPTATPGTSAARLITFNDTSNAVLMGIRIHNDGKFDICNSSVSRVVASTVTWSANNWYRIDWQWHQASVAAPELTVRLFTTDPEGTTADDEITYTASGLTTTCQRWTFGFLAGSAAYAGIIDTIRFGTGNDLFWMDPFDSGELLMAGGGEVYDGESETWKKFKPKVQKDGKLVSAKTKVYKNGKWVTTK